jgi:hypothetical protein
MIVGNDIVGQRQQLNSFLGEITPRIREKMLDLVDSTVQYYELVESTRHIPFPINLLLNCSVQCLFRVPGAYEMLESFAENGEVLPIVGK